jgi:hypothetical protein
MDTISDKSKINLVNSLKNYPPLIFPHSKTIISKKDFKTLTVTYILKEELDYNCPHSYSKTPNPRDSRVFLNIQTEFYIQSVLYYILSLDHGKYDIKEENMWIIDKVADILQNHSNTPFTLQVLQNLDFSFAITRTPGLVGVVIHLSRDIKDVNLLLNHVKKFLKYSRIKDVPCRIRIPRSFVLYAFLRVVSFNIETETG